MPVHELRTERLVLRQWRGDDRDPWAALNADPVVMEHFPATHTRKESDRWFAFNRDRLQAQGWGLWAVEVVDVAPFVGFIGLSRPGFAADFTPCVEVGWRLAAAHWGRGYAPEGARAALAFAWEVLGLDEVVSFTAVGNRNSRRVMEKLGLVLDREFDHPSLPEGDPLRRHVLYRICAPG